MIISNFKYVIENHMFICETIREGKIYLTNVRVRNLKDFKVARVSYRTSADVIQTKAVYYDSMSDLNQLAKYLFKDGYVTIDYLSINVPKLIETMFGVHID